MTTDELLADLRGDLTDFVKGSFDSKSASISQMSLSDVQTNESISSFIERIVADIVHGPMQEVFSGKEIIGAIKQSKAISFSAAFTEMSKKSISIAFEKNFSVKQLTFKDFRDFFGVSVLQYAIDNNVHPTTIEKFLSEHKILDKRNSKFHDALTEYCFKYIEEDKSGVMAFAVLFDKGLPSENNSKESLWGKAPHMDSLFII